MRERGFSLLPEFKIPKKKEDGEGDPDEGYEGPRLKPEWIWNEGGEETMHPFWAVRRMTAAQLARARLDVKPTKMLPRFNCELVMRSVSLVAVCSIEEQQVSRTRIFQLPFLTNFEEIREDEELILEIAEVKKTKPGSKENDHGVTR